MILEEFLEHLASKDPTPGGGSVGALSGALSAALVEMVANLTLGKKKYESVQDEMEKIKEKAHKIREEMIAYISLDAEAFNKVMEAYQIPKENEGRSEAIQKALKGAIEIPENVMKSANELTKLCMTVKENGNINALSDAKSAATMAAAAIFIATFNIEINLSSLKDSNFIQEKKKIISEIQQKAIITIKQLISI